MPIWLRRFTFNEMREFYIKEKEEYDKATGNSQTMKTVDQLIKAGPKDLCVGMLEQNNKGYKGIIEAL